MVKVTPQLIIGASLASAATAGLAYAIYFDHKRRNDPEFRRALLKEQRKLSKASEKAASRERLAQSESLKAAVRQMRNDSPPTRVEDREAYFLEQVASGEALAAKGPQFYVAAAISFFKGLQVYPNPQELLMIYSKTQPEEVVNLLMDAVKYSMTLSGPSGPAGAAILEEIDTDTSASVRIGRIETQTSSSSADDYSAASSPHSGSYVAVTPPLADG